MKKKLFVTDFDGTLLKDDKTISCEDIRTLDTLGRKDVVTVIATGRSIDSFEKALMDMGRADNPRSLPVDYIIFSTGAGIIEFSPKKLIFKKNLPCRDVQKISNYFDHRKFDYMVHKAIPDTRQFLYKSHGRYNPDFQARLALYKDHALPLEADHPLLESATEVLAILPNGIHGGGLDKIKTALSDFSVIHATSPLDHESAWIEIFHRDVSKSQAVCFLAQKLGIGQHQVVSVGNDYNDQDLLAWSGIGFVVENAPDRLKQLFKITLSNNRSGVTRAAKASGLL